MNSISLAGDPSRRPFYVAGERPRPRGTFSRSRFPLRFVVAGRPTRILAGVCEGYHLRTYLDSGSVVFGLSRADGTARGVDRSGGAPFLNPGPRSPGTGRVVRAAYLPGGVRDVRPHDPTRRASRLRHGSGVLRPLLVCVDRRHRVHPEEDRATRPTPRSDVWDRKGNVGAGAGRLGGRWGGPVRGDVGGRPPEAAIDPPANPESGAVSPGRSRRIPAPVRIRRGGNPRQLVSVDPGPTGASPSAPERAPPPRSLREAPGTPRHSPFLSVRASGSPDGQRLSPRPGEAVVRSIARGAFTPARCRPRAHPPSGRRSVGADPEAGHHRDANPRPSDGGGRPRAERGRILLDAALRRLRRRAGGAELPLRGHRGPRLTCPAPLRAGSEPLLVASLREESRRRSRSGSPS